MSKQKNKVQLGILLDKNIAVIYRRFLKEKGLVMGKDVENMIKRRIEEHD